MSDEFIDEYGNFILDDNKVYTWDGKAIDSPYKLQKNTVLERILYYSESDDSYYFLEEDNTFTKHDYLVVIDPDFGTLNPGTIYVPSSRQPIWSSSTRKIYQVADKTEFIVAAIKDDYSYSVEKKSFDCYANLKGYNIKNTEDASEKKDYTIIETDMKTGEEKTLNLKFDGKGIMEIDEVKVDDEGFITIKGYDTDYKKFEGYLDEDGNVTIEQPEYSSLSYHFDAIN